MLAKQDYILNTEEEYKQIEVVHEWIQNIHESGTFFNLSLRTLELIRRFNNLYIMVFEKEEATVSNLNQLVIAARGLDENLISEI